jgi:hypothetical protein
MCCDHRHLWLRKTLLRFADSLLTCYDHRHLWLTQNAFKISLFLTYASWPYIDIYGCLERFMNRRTQWQENQVVHGSINLEYSKWWQCYISSQWTDLCTYIRTCIICWCRNVWSVGKPFETVIFLWYVVTGVNTPVSGFLWTYLDRKTGSFYLS